MPTTHRTVVLRTLDELDRVLPKGFVLLVGSATSAVSPPYVPGVDQFRCTFLSEIAARPAIGYADCLASAYAAALVSGPHERIRLTTKFEEFLWSVEQASDRAATQALLHEIYATSRSEYGVTHAAIAELLRSGDCLACLTTNFDTCLEHAAPDVGSVVVYPRRALSRRELLNGSVIYKLHGNASEDSCISTSPDLAASARMEAHAYLPALLDGQTIFVVGYSGTGDIDIAPHLARCKSTFVWACRSEGDPLPWKSFVGFRVVLDLEGRGDAERRAPNLLVSLACKRGDQSRVMGAPNGRRDWLSKMAQWMTSHAFHHREFVRSLFSWRTSLPALHLDQSHQNRAHASHREIGWALVEGGASASGWLMLRTGLRRQGNRPVASDAVDCVRGMGFALWRLGMFGRARRTLRTAVAMAADSAVTPELRFETRRIYLEVCRDSLRNDSRQSRREEKARHWRLPETLTELLALTATSPETGLLARLLEVDFAVLIDRKGDVVQYQTLLAEALACDYFTVAWACASSLALVNQRDGNQELRSLERHFKEVGPRHYVRKCALSRFDARLVSWPTWIRVPSRSLGRQCLLDGCIGSLCRVLLRELDYLRWRVAWRWWQLMWGPGQRARIVRSRI